MIQALEIKHHNYTETLSPLFPLPRLHKYGQWYSQSHQELHLRIALSVCLSHRSGITLCLVPGVQSTFLVKSSRTTKKSTVGAIGDVNFQSRQRTTHKNLGGATFAKERPHVYLNRLRCRNCALTYARIISMQSGKVSFVPFFD